VRHPRAEKEKTVRNESLSGGAGSSSKAVDPARGTMARGKPVNTRDINLSQKRETLIKKEMSRKGGIAPASHLSI